MAQSLKKQCEAAEAKRSKAMDAVYATVYPRRDVVFSECLKLATPAVRDAYQAACDKVTRIECEAIAAGKAWVSTFGRVTFYR